MTQHTVNGGITRLAQMHEVAVGELAKQRVKMEEMFKQQEMIMHFMEVQLEEIRKGIDDVAVMLGIIEPPMPLMPPRVPTGPQPVSVYTCPQCGPDPAGADAHAKTHHTFPVSDLDRFQP